MRNKTSSPKTKIRTQSFSRALIWVDDAPLRETAAGELRKLYKAYSKHLHELEEHENVVRPSYYRWLSGLFGERIDRVRSLHAEFLRKSALLARMRELCIFDGFSRSSAFDRAHDEMGYEEAEDSEQSEFEFDMNEGFSEEPGDSEDASDSHSHGRSKSGFDDFEEELANFLGGDLNPRARETNRANEIKQLYRKLAQSLHPDINGNQTDFTRELWAETQEAYRTRDLDQLRFIWTLVSMQTAAATSEVRLFDMRAAAKRMQEKLRELKREKRNLSRTDPSWGFGRKNKDDLAARIDSDLRTDEDSLSGALEDLEEDLAVFSEPPEYHRGKRRKPYR